MSAELSFGMHCLDLAMRAKAGQLQRGEADALPGRALRDLPLDDEARVAAARFAHDVAAARAAEAGVALHDFVLRLSDRMIGSQNDAMARAVADVEHDWQRRADLR